MISSQPVGFHPQHTPIHVHAQQHSVNVPYTVHVPSGSHPDHIQANNIQIGFTLPSVDVNLPINPNLIPSAIPPVPSTPAAYQSQAPTERIELVRPYHIIIYLKIDTTY